MSKIEKCSSGIESYRRLLSLFEVQELSESCSVLWSLKFIKDLGVLWESFQDFDFLKRVNEKIDTKEIFKWKIILSERYGVKYEELREVQDELKKIADEAKKEERLTEFVRENDLQFIPLE